MTARENPTSEPAADRTGRGSLSNDTVFETLSNERRRHVVRYLLDRRSTVALGELARELAARENDKRPDAVTSEERRRVYNALQQLHLPKMDEHDLVSFDTARGTIAPTSRLAHVERYLDADDGRPWYGCYFALGIVCEFVAVATVFRGPLAHPAPNGVVAVVTSALFLGLATTHLWSARRV